MWDEDHPDIDIPPEIQDDIDNDWVIPVDKKEDLIHDYLAQIAEAKVSIESARGAAQKK